MRPEAEARRAMALTLGFDVISAFIAMAVAVFYRWNATGGAPPEAVTSGLISAGAFALAALAAFFTLRVHKQVWRHSGWPDAVKIVQAVALTALIFLPLMFLWNRLVGFPRSSLPVAVGIWLLLLFLGRMAALSRSTHRPFQIFRNIRATTNRSLSSRTMKRQSKRLCWRRLIRDVPIAAADGRRARSGEERETGRTGRRRRRCSAPRQPPGAERDEGGRELVVVVHGCSTER